MTQQNGSPPAEALAELAQAPAPPRPRAGRNADDLTPRDLLRARKMLTETGDLRTPYDLMDDPIEKSSLVIWCLKSRTDPGFTYEQALDTPYSEFTVGDEEPDPPTPRPAGPGISREPSGTPAS